MLRCAVVDIVQIQYWGAIAITAATKNVVWFGGKIMIFELLSDSDSSYSATEIHNFIEMIGNID